MNNAFVRFVRELRDGLADAIRNAGRAAEHDLRNTSRKISDASEHLADADRRASVDIAGNPGNKIGVGTRRGKIKYTPDPAETALQKMRFRKPDPDDQWQVLGGAMGNEKTTNAVYLVRGRDGEKYVFKPGEGEQLGIRRGLIPQRPGEYANREVAAYRVSHALDFGLVPPTTFTTSPRGMGRGSVQKFVPNSAPERVEDHPEGQRLRMAVLDYVIGNTDRHFGNFRTVGEHHSPIEHRKVLAIDHGLSFPEAPFGNLYGPFYDYCWGKQIPGDIMAKIRAVDQDQLRAALRDANLSTRAIDGSLGRLNELLDGGRIPNPPGTDFLDWL